MVFLEEGAFAGHTIRPLCLDRTEVTVSAYARCVESGRCDPPALISALDNWRAAGRERHPINSVTWVQAAAYCQSVGKRLPTEWEWEWGARGRDQARSFPWGEQPPTCARASMETDGAEGCGTGRTSAVGSRPQGDSRDGLHDMAGNVWEWTTSRTTGGYIVRGGSLSNKRAWRFETSFRRIRLPARRASPSAGFRCARDAD